MQKRAQEQRELITAGFYSDEFRRNMQRLQQDYTMAEIVELFGFVAGINEKNF